MGTMVVSWNLLCLNNHKEFVEVVLLLSICIMSLSK